jgi:CDP-glycerol glycerophosphotransferase (TagB/SpsB family)
MTRLRSFARSRVGTFRVLFLLRLLQWPIRSLTRPLLRRVPRDPALVAFGAASDRFADNPAYAFLAASQAPDLRCVWISGSTRTVDLLRRHGLRAERRWSWAGISVACRAGWFVYGWQLSDVNAWLSDGARTFNLWHGVGVKRIQRARVGAGAAVFSSPEGSFAARVFADDRHVPDLVLSTSPDMTPVLANAFGVAPDRCVELGYPRNDHLVRGMPAPDLLVDPAIMARLAGRTVVGYFPTFRDDSLSIPGGGSAVERLAEVVSAQGAVLLFKAHDASVVEVGDAASTVVLPSDADLNAYVGECDVLVTDYSSVASDFLVLGRPIVLYVPDIDDYAGHRGFALDPRDKLPGLVTRTFDELCRALADLPALGPPAALEELTAFYWSAPQAGAGARVREVLTRAT